MQEALSQNEALSALGLYLEKWEQQPPLRLEMGKQKEVVPQCPGQVQAGLEHSSPFVPAGYDDTHEGACANIHLSKQGLEQGCQTRCEGSPSGPQHSGGASGWMPRDTTPPPLWDVSWLNDSKVVAQRIL